MPIRRRGGAGGGGSVARGGGHIFVDDLAAPNAPGLIEQAIYVRGTDKSLWELGEETIAATAASATFAAYVPNGYGTYVGESDTEPVVNPGENESYWNTVGLDFWFHTTLDSAWRRTGNSGTVSGTDLWLTSTAEQRLQSYDDALIPAGVDTEAEVLTTLGVDRNIRLLDVGLSIAFWDADNDVIKTVTDFIAIVPEHQAPLWVAISESEAGSGPVGPPGRNGLDGGGLSNAQIRLVVDAAGHLESSENLSDVDAAATARANLGALSQAEVDARAAERYTDDEKTKLLNIAANATAVTIAQVLAKILQGDNVTIDDSVPGQITINATGGGGGGGLTTAQVNNLISMANIGDSQIASTIARDSEVSAAIAAVRDGVSAAYDTLAELAAAIPDLSAYRTSTQIQGIVDTRIAQEIAAGTQTGIEVTYGGGTGFTFTVTGTGNGGLTAAEVQALIDDIHVVEQSAAEDGIATTPGLVSAAVITAAIVAHDEPTTRARADLDSLGSGDVNLVAGSTWPTEANSPTIEIPGAGNLAFLNPGRQTADGVETGAEIPFSMTKVRNLPEYGTYNGPVSAANAVILPDAHGNSGGDLYVGKLLRAGLPDIFLLSASSSSFDMLPATISQLLAPATTGVTTVSDHARYAVVLTVDRTPTAADLADDVDYSTSSDTNQITLPVFTDNSYLWFLDRADQPDLTVIQQVGSPFNQVGSFLKLGSTLAVSDDEYSLWEHADDQGEAEQVYPGPNSGTTWRLE